MTELSALNIKITGDAGDLKAAVNTATGDLARLGSAAKATASQTGALVPAMATAGMAGGGFANTMRGVSQQLSQVGQQTMATGNFIQALAIQLPDIGLGFGAIGAAAGLLAGVALPMLVAAFTTNTEAATAHAAALERVRQAQEDLAASTLDTQTTIDKLRFGVDESFQVELLREQLRLRAEYTAKTVELNTYLATTTDSIDLQRIKTQELVASITQVANKYNENARLLDEQQSRAATLSVIEGVRAQRAGEAAAQQKATAEATERQKSAIVAAYKVYADTRAQGELLADAAERAGINASALADLHFGNIAAAAAWAGALADNLAAASRNYGKIQNTGESGPDAARRSVMGLNAPGVITGALSSGAGGVAIPSGGGGGGGGGGGAGRDFASELAAFQETLASETELEIAQYEERQTLLQGFLAAKVVTMQEYQAYMEQIKTDHEAKLNEIEATAYQQRLAQTASMFGALASIAQSGGERMAKAAAAFQAIEGTVNAYGAAIKALNTPGISLAGRFAAYASVLAAGLKGVAAIRSAGGIGGGGGAAAVASAPAASQGPLQVALNTFGAGQFLSMSDFGTMLDKLNEAAGDRGYTILRAS